MFDELAKELASVRKKLQEMRGYLDLSNKETRISKLEEEMSKSSFWDNRKKAQDVIKQVNNLRGEVTSWQDLKMEEEELSELLELAREEEEESLLSELEERKEKLRKGLGDLELKSILSDQYDRHSAILTIHAGAGGTESCDWANMLLRMYLRWGGGKGYEAKILDILPGEEAGVKNVTVLMRGEYAYGRLKAEIGVHRLVRISPFDAGRRRHTSFSSVDVIPEVEDEVQAEIVDSDLRIDTYRAGGAGGQHVNVTDSAVRITHLPTGITSQCQNERSQHQNKATALKVLRARLFEYYRKKQEEEMVKQRGEKEEIAWGSQIRSYIFQPYQMVKDHRTNIETSNVNAVMDGMIDSFIEAYLRTKR
ncbi:peptide chain release factor 2 [bacterium]|nr:peptide chain release factor 2 [bacterium]MCK4325129.1 peptide chain release factor 2 [bacterium]